MIESEPGRIRTLNLLTGGNLRTIVILYQVLARDDEGSIRADLEQLLDQYTPLYKHRFEAMSPQSQQVVDALALNWDPATAAELAEKLRMETRVVSSVLTRLDTEGVVEKAPSPPGEKMFFQISERFFNIWYLMRASRRVRRKLNWMVGFLKMFYGATELRPRARNLAQEPGKWDEAVVFARKFIVEGDDEYHEKVWPDIIVFLRDAIATGHTEDAVALLDESEYGERWRPLREALQAIAEDDSTYLLRVAPEVRQPAEEIVAMLLPEGVRLGASPKPASARRTRRKRQVK
jgi:DNA-binding MarR family transcriptional regulator